MPDIRCGNQRDTTCWCPLLAKLIWRKIRVLRAQTIPLSIGYPFPVTLDPRSLQLSFGTACSRPVRPHRSRTIDAAIDPYEHRAVEAHGRALARTTLC